ncbi:hypothetical protein Tco_0522117 [Tanacetum coccineum]
MNEDYYHEQNPCYDSNSFGYDQFQPPQYTVYHQILKSQNEFFNSQNEQFKSGYKHLNTQMTTLHDLIAQAMQKKEEEKRIAEEQAAKERYWKIPIFPKGVPKVCDVPFHDNSPPLDISKDQSEDFSDSNVDSTSTDEDSFSSNDVEYVEASPPNSEPVSSKVMEIVIPESTSTFPNLFLEETNTFDNSLPESETFSFNLEEISSGSPTTPSDLSLPDYKAFYIDNDHFKEKSSGSTTTHVDFSQYDSFIFDLSNDQFPPTDRSDFYHEEFADELAQIISQPEYDCFLNDEPTGNFTMDVVVNIFQTKEPRDHGA